MNFIELEKYLIENKEPSFRLKQIKKSYFTGKPKNFDEMTDISKDLRQKLSDNFKLLSVDLDQIYTEGNTQKALLKLSDDKKIESVLMDYDEWLTVCVSTQVGCPLNCQFCATGKMGFIRNLTVDEIVDQILFWNKQLFPKYVGRIVFMGMGEPFLNWDNVIEALKIINDKEGLNIGARKISISTAGISPRIVDFANMDSQYNLAISLHSVNPTIRETIMPVTKKYSLSELKDACRYYADKTNRQLFFEYALMDGINDSEKDAHDLSKFIKSNWLFYLNIIPLNQVTNGLKPSTQEKFNNFIRVLDLNRVQYSVRRSFGQKVNAACGQLACNNK